MPENDYINITNLARLQIAEQVLQMFSPQDEQDTLHLKTAAAAISWLRATYYKKVG